MEFLGTSFLYSGLACRIYKPLQRVAEPVRSCERRQRGGKERIVEERALVPGASSAVAS